MVPWERRTQGKGEQLQRHQESCPQRHYNLHGLSRLQHHVWGRDHMYARVAARLRHPPAVHAKLGALLVTTCEHQGLLAAQKLSGAAVGVNARLDTGPGCHSDNVVEVLHCVRLPQDRAVLQQARRRAGLSLRGVGAEGPDHRGVVLGPGEQQAAARCQTVDPPLAVQPRQDLGARVLRRAEKLPAEAPQVDVGVPNHPAARGQPLRQEGDGGNGQAVYQALLPLARVVAQSDKRVRRIRQLVGIRRDRDRLNLRSQLNGDRRVRKRAATTTKCPQVDKAVGVPSLLVARGGPAARGAAAVGRGQNVAAAALGHGDLDACPHAQVPLHHGRQIGITTGHQLPKHGA
mmetsp:Transcript_4722/g.13932  ORF Transcript_4722/g.13932 Transcript_4722/m.13932 type:complete len:346 (+) Transcript_4722:1317-2354(+)